AKPVVIGTTAYFTANNGTNGYELWKTDGTEAGTVMVKDIEPGAAGISAAQFAPELVAVGSNVYLVATTTATGTELWVSNGIDAGTTLLKDIGTGPDPVTPANPRSGNPSTLTAFGTKLAFTAESNADGIELWITDGTTAGTVLVKDVRPGPDPVTPTEPASSRARPLGVVGNSLLFSADDGTVGTELWKTDGTTVGTVLVKDIATGASQGVDGFAAAVVFDNALYFVGETAATGRELFRSDGTAAGTVLDTDIQPGAGTSNIASFVNTTTRLFFIADNGTVGLELWSVAATPVGGNTAPTLDNSGTPYIVAPAGARLPDDMKTGILITDLLARGAGGNPITDADAGAVKGIAITAIDKTLGKWQYTQTVDPVEGNWIDVDAVAGGGTISEASALLLPADTTTRVRFVTTLMPRHNNQATDGSPRGVAEGFLPTETKLDSGFTFRAWDRTAGSAGGRGDTTTNGGATAFSTATETVGTYFEVRLWRSLNGPAQLNTYTLEQEFNSLINNFGYQDRSTQVFSGFTVLMSPIPGVATAPLYRMYFGIAFDSPTPGVQTDMGYRYLTTALPEVEFLENLGPVAQRPNRDGTYFRENGVNNGTGIIAYIYTTSQPGSTSSMRQIYRTDNFSKDTRTGPVGTPATGTVMQQQGDHVYTTDAGIETTRTGAWNLESTRGFVRELAFNPLNLQSGAFIEGGTIPLKHTRPDLNLSPALSWATPPTATQSFVVTVIDTSAGNFIHWMIWNIPAASRSLAEGIAKTAALGDGSQQGENDFPGTGYDGPEPPIGSGLHNYLFEVSALDNTLALTPGTTTLAQLTAAMQGHILAQGYLYGLYSR
ncbi:MAG: YbhB/YbcL family Raf kinase inhibitor-like protein, partial [Planctomycetales bacterium]|nr:YbhB/YbcL family Raf kinase inhibitor-like protein [Planctomycetales bacterium]